MKITENKISIVFDNMMNRLNVDYPLGFYDWLRTYRKDLYLKLESADDTVNAVWEKCLVGEASLLDFVGVGKIFERLMLQGYELMRGRG